MSMWKKTMDYLGLGPDEAYDDYEDDDVDERAEFDSVDEEEVVTTTRPVFPSRGDTGPIRRPSGEDPSVKVRTVRPSPRNADPVTVRPRGFEQAQEVADAFKVGQPVIMNLEGSDREIARRLIDFASGLCYALDGTMEKIANGVYLLKPSNHPGGA
ncbi:MAG: cell division protein SepF [Actinobacteria bacterium]|jgi:cell division inhibitor SepF|nr:cell division protein SepF [Actinomycetota bacterium]